MKLDYDDKIKFDKWYIEKYHYKTINNGSRVFELLKFNALQSKEKDVFFNEFLNR